MDGNSSCPRRLAGLTALALLLAASAARAETPRWTVRALGSDLTSLAGTRGANLERPEGFVVVNAEETKSWFGVDLDLRLLPWASVDLGLSRGGLRETMIGLSSTVGNFLVERRTGPVQHVTLSLLYHPISPLSGHRVDLYLGPTIGRVRYGHAFAPSEDETAIGGKLGFDVQLAATGWTFTSEASSLKSPFHVLPEVPKRDVAYQRVAVGLSYHF
ncbi:MAG TPA: hypothetical protein VIH93_04400 [Thermoanaerobaculia bacterium]